MPRRTGRPRAALSQGCIYAATKSPGAILVNALRVDPKGGGQDARRNDRMAVGTAGNRTADLDRLLNGSGVMQYAERK